MVQNAKVFSYNTIVPNEKDVLFGRDVNLPKYDF